LRDARQNPTIFLALLIASLVVNVALFLSPYKWENDSSRGIAGVQIECDPNCSPKNNPDEHRDEIALARFYRKILDDPLTAFTGVLALATFLLAIYTGTVANATKATADHIPRVERAYVSGGATGVEGSPQEFAVTLDNYGKTPAFIGTIWANIVPENELPDTPVYAPPEFGRFGGQMLKPDTSGHPVVIRQWDVIGGRVIYGRIWYRDIFKQCHSAGFILRILGPGRTIAVANRDAYWEDRPEPDLGPASTT
jgi:hypothetical protein